MSVGMWIGEGATLGSFLAAAFCWALVARVRRWGPVDPEGRRFLRVGWPVTWVVTGCAVFNVVVQVLRYTGRV